MTEKRFYLNEGEVGILKILDLKEDSEAIYHTASKSDMKMIVELLNELAEENQFLKEKEKDMLDYLKKEYDYVYKQKIKHFDDAILVNCYELIEYHIRSMIEHLERL